jgi:hypothetical protein
MHASATISQPKILVIQNELLGEMRLAREYAGREPDDAEALREQLAAIVEAKEIGAAILDTDLDIDAATAIADILVDLEVPFVFAGSGDTTEVPEQVMALTMAPDLASLTLLGQSILGRPTYH